MIRRRLAALVAAAMLAASFAGATVAHDTQTGTSCGTAYAEMYGNGSFSPYQHNLKACYWLNAPYMTAIKSHTATGDPATCRDWIGQDHGHFDNCVTSINVNFVSPPANLKFCLYVDENYGTGGGGLVVIGDWYSSNLSGAYNDKFSSFKWTTGNC